MKVGFFVIIVFVFSIYTGNAQPLPEVLCSTALGDIVFEIDTIHAPVTAKNFLNHVEMGTYKNAVFYRVVRMDNQPQNKD